MADINAPSGQAPAMAPLVRTDDQIFPRIRWVPIRKCNCYLYLQKSQSNPINKIVVDLLKHTNFFRAFTASSTIPSIYIQQEALQITPVNNNQAFIAPPSSDALINFVNLMGYPKLVRNLSNVRRHKFHPRLDSSLHLPNEEPVLGYLKFSANGTKREVFKMPIPDSLITADIQKASYYREYLAKVAQHRRYLAGETVSDMDSPVLKPTKLAMKHKSTAPKAPPRPSVSTPVTSAQPTPTSAPGKPQEKKRKKRSLKNVAESVAEDEPAKEPQVFVEDTDLQKALEESMKACMLRLEVRSHQWSSGNLSQENINRSQRCQERAKQRRASEPTGSSRHDASPYAVLGQSGSEEESEKAGSKPNENSKVLAGPDPGNAGANELSMPSHVVHTGSNHEHMDLDVADVSSQPSTVFGDMFFNEKPSKADNNKANAKTEVESIVTQFKATTTNTTTTTTTTLPPPPAQQQSTTESMMMKRIGELEHIMANLIQEKKGLEERLDSHGVRLYTLEQLDIPHRVRKAIMPPLPPPPLSTNQESQSKGSVVPSSSKTAASAEYQAWTTTNIRLRPSISLTPTDLEIDEDLGLDEQAQSSDDEEIGIAHIPKVNLRQDWWKPFEEERPTTLKPAWSIRSSDVPVLTNNWASALASNYSPPPEDSLLTQTSDIAIFMDWFCKRRGIIELKPQDLEGPTFEIIKVFHPDVIILQYQMEECHKLLTDIVDDPILRHNVSKPLPLGGPPGQVIIKSDFFFNKYLEYLRYGSKGHRPTLSILKMKAVYYPDDGLEQMVPDQFWIEEECKYDIAAMAVMCRDKYEVQMMMHFNEIHKFSDGTPQQINEALDYRVKEFRINKMNPSLNMRFWTRKDVDRSKAFDMCLNTHIFDP
nr:E-beta-farnesene synthase [Tanacetum cinerariifolium]